LFWETFVGRFTAIFQALFQPQILSWRRGKIDRKTVPQDTLLCPRWIVPIEPAGVVLEDHCVALRGGLIEAIVPLVQADPRFSSYERVTLPEHALLPGLVNAHTHAAMSLMRGICAGSRAISGRPR
jgi:imidazolonepropionase-like amidohydrolase